MSSKIILEFKNEITKCKKKKGKINMNREKTKKNYKTVRKPILEVEASKIGCPKWLRNLSHAAIQLTHNTNAATISRI